MTGRQAPPYDGAVMSRGRLGTWWARNFFKRRLVLALETPSGRGPRVDDAAGYTLVSHDATSAAEVAPPHRAALEAELGASRLAARLADPRLTVFIAAQRDDGEVGGFVWALRPLVEDAWHDSVVVRPGTALLFNGYVAPPHRRKRLFTDLMVAVQDHCLEQLGCARVLGVVEASNVPSLRTLKGLGYRHVGDNYLVKVLRRNVVSVFVWRDGRPTEAHVVSLTTKGRTL